MASTRLQTDRHASNTQRGRIPSTKRWGMRLQRCAVMLLVGLILTACRVVPGTTLPRPAARTIDEAAWLGAACARAQVGPPDFTVQRRQPRGTTTLVLYTATCPDPGPNATGPEHIVGYVLVQPWKDGWDARAGGYYVDQHNDPPGTIARDDIGYGEKGEQRIIFGEIRKPAQVVAVEVTLSNGRVLRDDLSAPFFLLTAPAGVDACERRVLAADGTVLERKNLGPMIPACQAQNEGG